MEGSDWLRFGITASDRRCYQRYIDSVAPRVADGFPNHRMTTDDVKQCMWLKLLTFLSDLPPDFWASHKKLPYLRAVMYRAALDCVDRVIEDAPYDGGRRKNWRRMVSFEEVLL